MSLFQHTWGRFDFLYRICEFRASDTTKECSRIRVKEWIVPCAKNKKQHAKTPYVGRTTKIRFSPCIQNLWCHIRRTNVSIFEYTVCIGAQIDVEEACQSDL